MKRILFLIIRLLYRIPGWLLKIRSYNKHIENLYNNLRRKAKWLWELMKDF